MDDLSKWREEIDKIDQQLVELLAERFSITDRMGIYKKEHSLNTADPAREAAILDSVSRLATEHGLDPQLARELYPIILRYSKKSQNPDQNKTLA